MSSQIAPNTRKPTWREVLNHEFKKIVNSDINISELNEFQIRKNKKLINHAITSFVSLIIPLTMTFALVVLIMNNFAFYKDKTYIFAYYTPFSENETDTSAQKIWTAIINSLIFATAVIVQTVILYLLYKYKQILSSFNIPMDIITFIFLLVNYSVVGMFAIFTPISLQVQKIYHIVSSALIGCTLIRVFPEMTGWVILAVLVVWDLVAVLCPFGPLKLLVETAAERGETLFPALIFKSNHIVLIIAMVEPDHESPRPFEHITIGNRSTHESESPDQPIISSDNESDDTNYQGSQLGLGDFIFFGILIGKASLLGDMNVIFGCYISIIFGFLITYLILITFGKALPALPASLILGLIVYFCFVPFVNPYLSYLTTNRIII
ncbi:hypothetical protein MXB_789 [Myxobolus squamalis]|nr:hypothetical protein MXB_789 [Myxobolus squamalis]